MAEQVMLVCDVCGEPAQETVGIRAGGKGYIKDLCARHVQEILQGARAPRRGRPRVRPATTATVRKVASAKAASPQRAKKATARRRRRTAAASSTG